MILKKLTTPAQEFQRTRKLRKLLGVPKGTRFNLPGYGYTSKQYSRKRIYINCNHSREVRFHPDWKRHRCNKSFLFGLHEGAKP